MGPAMRRLLMLFYLFIIGIPALIAQPTDASDQPMSQISSKWKCKVLKQYACTLQECNERKPELSIYINFGSNEYKRCTKNQCDTYKFNSNNSGIYTAINVIREGGAYFIVVNDGSEFTESISQGMWTMSAFGQCTP